MITYLTGQEDLAWLQDVHGVPATEYAAALLTGQEDAPDVIRLYRVDNVNCVPDTWTRDEESGELHMQREGKATR